MNMKMNIAIALVLLLCLTSSASVQSVKSQSTNSIYIRPDGSISGTSEIQHKGNLYTLTGNINDQILVVECNNIVVDGGSFTLQGAGGWGVAGVAGKESSAAINLTCSNVTIQNFKITGWEVGIYCAWLFILRENLQQRCCLQTNYTSTRSNPVINKIYTENDELTKRASYTSSDSLGSRIRNS